jgi:hypothetical protein
MKKLVILVIAAAFCTGAFVPTKHGTVLASYAPAYQQDAKGNWQFAGFKIHDLQLETSGEVPQIDPNWSASQLTTILTASGFTVQQSTGNDGWGFETVTILATK